MTAHQIARRLWHLVPGPVRQATRSSPVVRALKNALAPSHNDLYDREYYRGLDLATAPSAPFIVGSIVRDLAPRTLIDLGCGSGAMLDECRRQGIRGRGLEYSDGGIAFCRSRGLDVTQFDLERDRVDAPAELYDVALSMEVAEHLPEPIADVFVDALVSQSRTIVFSAAPPGQGGLDHVNEQPAKYWIAKFAPRGYVLDEPLSQAWRAEWKGRVAWYYANNVMVFHRGF